MESEPEKYLWERVKRYGRILRLVPGLKMCAVCNNLSFGKVHEESDIDLFIVAEKGRLFTVRFFVTGLLHVLGVRRHHDKIAGRFCLSFFVDESHVDLSDIALENDIYLAFWITSLKPIIDAGMSHKIVKKNAWVMRFFGNEENFVISRDYLLEKSGIFEVLKFVYKWTFDLIFGWLLEFLLKKWQLKRARQKVEAADENASLIVSENILKFHNFDRRKEYRDRWISKGGAKINEEKFLERFAEMF